MDLNRPNEGSLCFVDDVRQPETEGRADLGDIVVFAGTARGRPATRGRPFKQASAWGVVYEGWEVAKIMVFIE